MDDRLIGMRSATRVAVLALLVAGCGGGGATQETGTTGVSGTESGGSESGGPARTCAEGVGTIEVDGICYCMPGTSWVDPFDPLSYDCGPLEPRPGDCSGELLVAADAGTCRCEALYTWCVWDPAYEMPTEDTVFDLSCCLDPAQDPGTTGETTTGETTTGETTTGDSGGSSGASTSTDTSTG